MTRREVLAAAIGTTLLPANSAATVQNSRPRLAAIHVPARTDRFGKRQLLFGVAPHDCKLSSDDTAGALFIAESAGSAKPNESPQVWIGPPLHVHFGQDEWFYILEGQFHFQIGDARFIAGPGDSIFGPRNVPHTWSRLPEGRLLEVFQPAGTMEEYFRTLASLPTRSGPPTPAEQARLSAEQERLFAKHGMKVVGPPLVIK